MASKEFITKRIAGKKAEIEKLNKKLERIEKAEASNWENNPYYYDERDKRYTLKDIAEAKEALLKYEEELIKAEEMEASRNVPAITEFLDAWKARMTQYYMGGLNEYYNEYNEVRRLYDSDKAAYETAYAEFKVRKYGKFEKVSYVDRWGKTRTEERKVADGYYEQFAPYYRERNIEEASAKLERDLRDEYNRKYDFIITRTNEIVGQITDASNLKVGAKGDLNGWIVGTKGCCSVKTIGAGGYNIQCFHFRTLIHPYTPAKPQITADTNFKVMSIEELKDICTKLGAECKMYDNEAIYRMRLVMAIKKAI